MALTCRPRLPALVKAIVAVQTVSDYLDNLCDRMAGDPDPANFALLHEAMMCCVDPDRPVKDYYGLCRTDVGDGGYLDSLVETSRSVLRILPNYHRAQRTVSDLARLYCELQVTKHLEPGVRDDLMAKWFALRAVQGPWRRRCDGLAWWEFGAAAGSTLGMFSLICASGKEGLRGEDVVALDNAYFPHISGLHILLDYYIDQDEDRLGGDLNFVSYYPSLDAADEAMVKFIRAAIAEARALPKPDRDVHLAVAKGLLAMYLSDPKVKRQGFSERAEKMISAAGRDTGFLTKSCGLVRTMFGF